MNEPQLVFRGCIGVVLGLVCASCSPVRERPPERQVPGGDEVRGREALAAYGCGSCHFIPGVEGAIGRAAAPLTAFAERAYVGGMLPNNPESVIVWIVDPRAVNPQTAMPNVGVSAEDARDMTAYLYTLRAE